MTLVMIAVGTLVVVSVIADCHATSTVNDAAGNRYNSAEAVTWIPAFRPLVASALL
jgi:hypothetical protein